MKAKGIKRRKIFFFQEPEKKEKFIPEEEPWESDSARDAGSTGKKSQDDEGKSRKGTERSLIRLFFKMNSIKHRRAAKETKREKTKRTKPGIGKWKNREKVKGLPVEMPRSAECFTFVSATTNKRVFLAMLMSP